MSVIVNYTVGAKAAGYALPAQEGYLTVLLIAATFAAASSANPPAPDPDLPFSMLGRKTINDGNDWLSRRSGILGGVVNDLIVDPGNASRVFAATEDGLFLSTDAALSWNSITDDEFGIDVGQQFFLDLDLSGSALYGARNCEVTATLDADQVSSTQLVFCVAHVDADPTTPSRIIAGGTNETTSSQAVAISTNSAASFTVLDLGVGAGDTAAARPQLLPGVPGGMAVAFLGSDPADGRLLHSVDDGDNWTDVTDNLRALGGAGGSGVAIGAFSVSPADPDLWLVGALIDGSSSQPEGFFRSADRGQTWSQVADLTHEVDSFTEFTFDPANANRIFGRGQVSTDGGVTWQTFVGPLPFPVYAVGLPSGAPDTVYIGGFSFGVVKTDDGGTSWQRRVAGLDAGNVQGIDVASNGALLALSQGTGVFRSADNGASWTETFSIPDPLAFPAFNRVRFAPADPMIAYATIDSPTEPMIKSIDGGVTWTMIDLGLAMPTGLTGLEVDAMDPDRVMAGNFGGPPRFLQTVDGGASWTERPIDPGLGTSSVTDLVRDPADVDRIFVSVREFSGGVGGVYRTTDGGRNWERMVSGLPVDFQPEMIEMHPEDASILYTGGLCSGVYRSDDGGDSWGQLADSGECVHSLHFAPGDANRLISNEQLLSFNRGDSWDFLGVRAVESLEIRFNANADLLVAAANSNGVYVRSIDPGNVLSGLVTDDQLVPVASARIDAFDQFNNEFFASGFADGSGQYRLILPDGDYFLLARAEQPGLVDQTFDNAPCPGGLCDRLIVSTTVDMTDTDRVIDFTLMAGHAVSGSVTDQLTGDPVSGSGQLFDDADRFQVSFGIVAGAYALPTIPTGNYRLLFSSPGFTSVDQSGVLCDGCDPALITPITIDGDAVIDVTLPREGSFVEIDLQRPTGTSIADGTTDNVGNLALGANTLTYTIANDGNINLTLSPPLLASPINVNSLQLTTAPDLSVAPGGATSFTVSFDNPASGLFSFTISIDNIDSNETPYDITVSGFVPSISNPVLAAELPPGMLLVDNDGDGKANPSDTVRYAVILRNDGDRAEGDRVSFAITAPTNTSITRANRNGTVDGSVVFDAATISAEFFNLAGGGAEFQDLVTFDLLISNEFNLTELSLQGQFRFGPQLALTDDPSILGGDDPTRLEVGRLSRVQAALDAGQFGAATAMSDNLVVVGSPDSNGGMGGATVYGVDSVGQLVLIDEIEPPMGFMGSGYGSAVAIEGETLVIGSVDAPANVRTRKGIKGVLAGLYRFNAGVPELAAAISENLANDFGAAVDLDGDTLVIGAPGQMVGGAEQAGAVYMFSVDALLTGSIDSTDIIMPQTPLAMSRFGSSVACREGKIAIGFPGPLGSALAGGAALYDAVSQSLTNLPIPFNGTGEFGAAVEISENSVLIGAPAASGQGGVFMFDLDAAQIGEITALDIGPGFRFGRSLSLDGNSLYVGSPTALTQIVDNQQGSFGAIYEFALDSGQQMQKIGAFSESSGTFAQQESFGAAVSAAEGSVLIGAPTSLAGRGAAAFRPSDAFEPPDPDTLLADGFECRVPGCQ